MAKGPDLILLTAEIAETAEIAIIYEIVNFVCEWTHLSGTRARFREPEFDLPAVA